MQFFFSVCRRITKVRKMSVFVQGRNPITGKAEWVCQDTDYDYHQEVARSAFADMLHDTDRNQKYYAAIKKAIKNLHDSGKEAHVLDIGTGTGILSMMAVRAHADSVTACEAFIPMANCAEKIIRANGMSDKIKLVKKRSHELCVGEKEDLKQRANVLVTEVFDTELIGEGAISVFNHAHEKLLTEDAVVIPSLATIYVQVVESPLAYSWSNLKALANSEGEILLNTPHDVKICKGESAVHDIQLSQFDHGNFKNIAGPMPIFTFDWAKGKIPRDNKNVKSATARCTGLAQVVFFWWELQMDMNGEIILSCAPSWSYPEFNIMTDLKDCTIPLQNVIPWRDHWMQAVYYLPKAMKLTEGQTFLITGHHDEWSFWFNVSNEEMIIPRICCSCEVHTSYPRSRIGQINNNLRNKKYLSVFEDMITRSSNVLVLSTGSLLCLSIAKMGAQFITFVEEHSPSARIISSFMKNNDIHNVKIVPTLDDLSDLSHITHVIAEPYYICSILPWENFYFGTLLNKIKDKLREEARILPVSASIYAMPVEFLDLHKIKSPLGICEGFDLSIFDKFIEESSELADSVVEAQPLWEYPCKALSLPQEILSVDFKLFMQKKDNAGTMNIIRSGVCNGIALWVDWKLLEGENPRHIVSTGPQLPIDLDSWIQWDMYTKQGVHLFTHPKVVTEENSVEWSCSFTPTEGEINFRFKRE